MVTLLGLSLKYFHTLISRFWNLNLKLESNSWFVDGIDTGFHLDCVRWIEYDLLEPKSDSIVKREETHEFGAEDFLDCWLL